MRILILIAMIIVFVSAFFIFFTFEVVLKDYINCSYKGDCSTEVSGTSFLFGLSIIGVFILLSGGAVYIVMKIAFRSEMPYTA